MDIPQQQTKNKEPKQPKDQFNKLAKKLTNAIAALTRAEQKNWDDLIQNEPSNNLFAFHFGTGAEDDYVTLKNYLTQFGQFKLQLYPVKNYAYVEFPEVEQAEKVIAQLIKSVEHPHIKYIPLLYSNKERPTMFFYSKVKPQDVGQSLVADIPNASYEVSIPGLTLIKDYITVEQERYIMQQVDKQHWTRLNQRRVQHYGYDFIYGANTVNTDIPAEKPIPEFLTPITKQIDSVLKGTQKTVDQLTINEYFPGMGIPPHFDVHPPFHEKFVVISLLSGLVMSFKSPNNQEQHLYLPPRSLALFEGEVRYAWFHSIASRKMDKVDGEMLFRRRRVSLTFRTIRSNLKCECDWPLFCQSQGYDPLSRSNPTLSQKIQEEDQKSSKVVPCKSEEEHKLIQTVESHEACAPTDVEKKYVYEIYDKIAPHFSSTRYKAWPKIEAFLNNLECGSLVGDIGCGNGKYLHCNQGSISMIGTDRSENLLSLCKEKDKCYQVFSADSLKLPLRSECFDAVISIAVIHHFSNRQLRIKAIKELKRITKVGGKILIYVWAFEQDEKVFKEQDVFVPWNLQFKFEDQEKLQPHQEEEKKEQLGVEDYQINEQKKTVVYKRYYHVFKKGEIENLISEIPGLELENNYYDHANWVVVLKKNQ